jgi:hypothetical protein
VGAILAEVIPAVIREAIRGAVGGVVIPAVVEGPTEDRDLGVMTSKIIRKCSHSFEWRALIVGTLAPPRSSLAASLANPWKLARLARERLTHQAI